MVASCFVAQPTTLALAFDALRGRLQSAQQLSGEIVTAIAVGVAACDLEERRRARDHDDPRMADQRGLTSLAVHFELQAK